MFGTRSWKVIADRMQNRTARQCRERFKDYLSPELVTKPWTDDEDDLLYAKYLEFGPIRARISTFFEGRSDISVENHWADLQARSRAERQSSQTLPMVLTLQKVAPQDFSAALPLF
jgi:hypothetical protein